MTATEQPPTIGYLCSQYPAASHTFIRREIAALRRANIRIETFSVRRRHAGERMSALDRAEYERTSFILPAAGLTTVATMAKAFVRAPVLAARTFRSALSHRAPGVRALVWTIFHFIEAVLLAEQLRRREVSHLHCHFANSGATIGFLASRLARINWSLTLHGISETDYPAGLTLAAKIADAEFVVCASWFVRAQAMRLVDPGHWSKLIIVRCGVDFAELPEADRRDARSLPRIVCVGRLSPEKGQAGLIEALVALRRSGTIADLVLVGDGPDRATLEAQVAASELGGHVRFAGQLDEPAALAAIAASDLLVLPSLMEGLPVVLMEAMAIGVPVVASRVAGIPELVEDGVTGRLFHPGDWAGLAHAIEAALIETSRDGREAQVAAARATVARQYEIGVAVAPLRAAWAAGPEIGA